MQERTFGIRTFGVDALCDKCKGGLMEQTGITLPTDPPLWRHKCDRCGDVADLGEKYPTVRFERVHE